MKRVIFHSGAELDLLSAAAYYENQRSGLGRELRQEIEAAVARIRENPRQFAPHTVPDTRRCLVHRFPYTIFFTELEDSLWLIAIAHHKRRPGYWSHRRPG
ncbi:MAG TPA: type II toxin-antitoxin system RelE/ParE family toxin [Thermoanaerobaculia bacterium]|nr:type II toxin-antitoxin system RelE/ParE family toxin [Thermoanaerobaculia bacterium]